MALVSLFRHRQTLGFGRSKILIAEVVSSLRVVFLPSLSRSDHPCGQPAICGTQSSLGSAFGVGFGRGVALPHQRQTAFVSRVRFKIWDPGWLGCLVSGFSGGGHNLVAVRFRFGFWPRRLRTPWVDSLLLLALEHMVVVGRGGGIRWRRQGRLGGLRRLSGTPVGGRRRWVLTNWVGTTLGLARVVWTSVFRPSHVWARIWDPGGFHILDD